MKKRDNFEQKTVDILAKRASYICSQPECKALTICPSDTVSDQYLYIGEAAHITAAAPGGPRYDESLSVEERRSIENAIFLCSCCADMIDKNKGADFSIQVLRDWKLRHEAWVRSNLNKSIYSLIPKDPIQSNERPVVDLCHRGISVVEIEKDKLYFDIPYCSGKNANAYNVKLKVAVIVETVGGFVVLTNFMDSFPDNICLTYEIGKSMLFWISHPMAIHYLSCMYICVKGNYQDATETLNFAVFDVFKYNHLSGSWVRLVGEKDIVVREEFNKLELS
jgi:hypothetical protein